MSRLNNIYTSYGKTFRIAIANTYSYNVMTANGLPKNTLIISSPDENGHHSMIVTDSYGIPVRLTYNVELGNGITETNGAISLEVDNNVFTENENGELTINKTSIIDNDTIKVVQEKLSIDTQNIICASSLTPGVIKVDGNTILSDNGIIYVDTTKLDYSNNTGNVFGVVRSSDTITANNGILSINTENIDKISANSYGILKTDNNSILAYNGILSVNINSFRHTSSYSHGISKPDNNSIYKTNENVLKINYNALRKASAYSFGLLKSDGETTIIENGVLSIKNYSELQQTALTLGSTISYLDNRLDEIEIILNNLRPTLNGPHIFTLVCDGLSSIELAKPEEYGELPEDMEIQKITAKFIVNTNCPFKISLNYIDNISPSIELYEINYNDIDKYPGQTGLTRTFQSTNEEDVKISFSWLCKNYRDTDNTNYSTKTKIILDVLYTNDVSISKETKYSIVRFNSLYNDSIINNNDDEILVGDENGLITPILDYSIQLNDDPDRTSFPEVNTKLYGKHTFTYSNDREWPRSSSYGNISTISIGENTSYLFRGTNVDPQFINLYVNMGDDTDTPVFNRSLSSDELETQIMLNQNNDVQTNVLLNTNSNNEIYFTYKFV